MSGQWGPLYEASLQIISGPHIGRILVLKKNMTRIGNPKAGIAVISRRKDGFYISALENLNKLEVNNTAVGDNSVKLANNDIITINDVSMQFYSQNENV